ncbi:N-acetylglucosamine kinase [Oceanicoccus sagamiensis]|uniref:ATPase n=1 Tax=Oceanicoccus sagamiensis TaxID=716816 RepID=A0A1X9NJP6_9GAMM|nr:BadF/BadG/BcrA/BcrD ATPase family protein [Oceanicoccus sagamiensis]ARN75097.1 ATPase [Oceanicoccus sagamiensis]
MNTVLNSKPILYLGIDGGGSKCKARVTDEHHQVLGTAVAGPANASNNFDLSLASITESAEMAMVDAGFKKTDLANVIAGIGLAGVNLPGAYKAMSEWQHPFARMFLTTDLHIACLGAHGGEQGAVIIAGTGSCGCLYTDNKTAIYGGHGFPYGDKGSGAWMGLQALQTILLAGDGLVEPTLLTEKIERQLNASGLSMVETMVGASPRQYGKLAPLVLEAAQQGDAAATAIIKDGASYISAMARKLLDDKPARFSMLGGLSEKLIPWMDDDIIPQISAPLDQPDAGAIYFAESSLKAQQ